MVEFTNPIIDVLSAVSGRKSIDPTDRIFHDLGVAGDDFLEVVESLRKKYNIIIELDDFSLYFPNETEAFIFHMLPFLKKKKKPITVNDLERMARIQL